MKIKATKVAELEYIDVEVTALNTKISLGWHTKEQAAELRDMLLSVVDDLSGFIEERPFGYVKPEQILITADEAETLKELMEHALAGTQCHLLGRVSEHILYNKLAAIAAAQEQK